MYTRRKPPGIKAAALKPQGLPTPLLAIAMALIAILFLSACTTGQDTGADQTREQGQVGVLQTPEAEQPPGETPEAGEAGPGTEIVQAPGQEPTPVANPETQITITQLTADPAAYFNRTVMVQGSIGAVIDQGAFTLVDNILPAAGQVLVVDNTAQIVAPELPENALIRVVGELRTFVQDDVEQRLGYTITPEDYNDFEEGPVLFAALVEVLAEDADPGMSAGPGTEGTMGLGADGVSVPLQEIAAAPSVFVGRVLTVDGSITQVRDEQTITLSDDSLAEGQEILVVLDHAETAHGNGELQPGTPVRVTGQVREFVLADLDQASELAQGDEWYAPFENAAVIHASEIEFISEPATE
jgi:uncharacterized protein YdeI (BOF family)